MRFDDTSLAIAERKRARIAALDYSEATLHEIPSFLHWAWSQPVLKVYMRMIIETASGEEREFGERMRMALGTVEDGIRRLCGHPTYLAKTDCHDQPDAWPRIIFSGKQVVEMMPGETMQSHEAANFAHLAKARASDDYSELFRRSPKTAESVEAERLAGDVRHASNQLLYMRNRLWNDGVPKDPVLQA
jgi:hypothetical protein